MKNSLDCKEVSRLISAGLDETMAPPERARLRYHFVICQTCRTVEEQMRFLSVAIKQMNDDLPSDGPTPR
jgi:hypothetical protein